MVRDNCVHGGAQGAISNGAGFSAVGNLQVDPHYVDRAAKDFRLAADSPCAGVLAGDSAPTTPPAGDPPPPPATDPGTSGQGTAPEPVTGPQPVAVSVAQATIRRSHRHGGRWRVRVAGRILGVHFARRAYVQVRRHGHWHRLPGHRIHRHFRFGVDARIPKRHRAHRAKVRVVVPGVGMSRVVAARVHHH